MPGIADPLLSTRHAFWAGFRTVKFSKLFPRSIQPGPRKGLRGKEALRHIAHLENAFPHICDMISTHVDLDKILWEITKECLHCVRAHRTTLFIMDAAAEILKEETKIVYTFDHQREQVYQIEEEEIAWKSFEEEKPFLLEIEDFPALFPGRNPNWELSSMMAFPFVSRKKPVGVLSAVLFNGKNGFDEEKFRLFSGFAKLASVAVEMADFLREIDRETVWRRNFEKYLDDVLIRLQRSGSSPGDGESASLQAEIPAGANGPTKQTGEG